MKALNRPMFRNGGPIKEGIMSGMKEPQAINTVGNNANRDIMGREKHAFFLPFLGANALRAGAMRMAPRAIQGIKNFFTTSKPAPFSPVTIGQSQGGKLLNLTPKVVRGGKGPNVKDVAQVSELKPYFANDPAVALVRGTYNALTNPKAKGLFAKGARFVLSPTGVITGGYYAAGKFFDGEGNEIDNQTAKDMGLTTGNKIDEKVIKGESDGSDGSTKTLNRDEEIEANRKRYYKLMGIDKMNKDAVYNTLIDASNQIREDGGTLRDQVKSGSLASGVINALSKNLDKSVDLKKQIDAAILKGEITKDINKGKDALTSELTRKRIQVADKQLAGPTLAETKAAYQKTQEPLTGQTLYAEATRAGEDIKGILDTKTAGKFLTDNPTLTEADFVKQIQQNRVKDGQPILPEGNYVVNGRIVHISNGGLVDEFIF